MSPKNDNIFIELYGLPGVGKTTLATKLAEQYGFTKILYQPNRLRYFSLFFAYPMTFCRWYLLVCKNYLHNKRSVLFWHNLALLFSTLQMYDDAKKISAKGNVVLEEGFLQRFLSYADVLLTEKEIKSLLKNSPTGNIKILVNGREVVNDRYASGDNLRSKQGEEYLSKWKEQQKIHQEKLANILKSDESQSHFETKNTDIDAILKTINSSH